MSPSHHWPHLTRLELSGVEGDRHAVMQCLRLHKDTLRSLCLQDFDLGETSWEKLLPDIRGALNLDDACICGDLAGCVEDGPDKGQPELWELNAPGIWENDMRASINRYCRNQGEDYPDEVPLTDEVVQRHFGQYVRCHVKKTQAEDWEDVRQLEEARELGWAGLVPPREVDSDSSGSGWDGYDSNESDEFDDEDDDDELVDVGHPMESHDSGGGVD